MDKTSKELIKLFHEISAKGYIEGFGNGWGNIGLTFENEIGKLPDSNYNPDYEDIEIKCTSRYSRYPLYLFTVAFDSNINEVMNLAEKYGYYDSDFPDKKVLFKKVHSNFSGDDKYNFVFDVDRTNEKIFLKVINSQGELLEREAYVTFDSLKEHILTKLNKVAFIKASKQIIDNKKYYRYYSIKLCKLKSFDTFLELIEKNLLHIEIIARISKSGDQKGRYRNKNINFSIRKDNIPLLFDCYYEYDYDTYVNY